jgi:hypothetical protein
MVGFCWNYNDCPSQQGMSLKVLQKQLKGCGECKKKLITNQTFIVFKNKHSNSPSYLLILNRPFF